MRPRARTLRAGILAVFPWADRARLEGWEARVRDEARRAPEPLLFVALLCGAQFRVFHLEVAPVLRDFGSWLTSHPRPMDGALAAIIVDAMTPAIEGAIRARPWQRGPEGSAVEIKGRPVETHGAWTAAVLVERYLLTEGIPAATALSLAMDLASALLNRTTAPNKYYEIRKLMELQTAELLAQMLGIYRACMATEGRRRLEPEPPSDDRLAHAKWQMKYRHLRDTLAVSGCEEVARDALKAIPAGLWPVIHSPERATGGTSPAAGEPSRPQAAQSRPVRKRTASRKRLRH